MKHITCLIAALIVVFSAIPVMAQSFDFIQTNDGTKAHRGDIKGMTSTEVTIAVNGVDRSVSVNTIVNLSYRDDPGELRKARGDIKAGNFGSAMEKLRRIDIAAQRPVIKQDIQFFMALCTAKMALAGNAEKGKAAGLMNNFKKVAPNSYHYYESVEVLGNLAAALGKFEAASKLYGNLRNAPWPAYKLRAHVLEGGTLLALEKYDDARKRFDTVISANVPGPVADRQKMLAKLGNAVCLAASGNIKEGTQVAESVLSVADASDIELHARAYNALGDCYRLSEKPKDALLAYLHTDILFNAQSDAHAEALYHLVGLWDNVNKKDRSVQARSLLKSRYSDSIWAQRL